MNSRYLQPGEPMYIEAAKMMGGNFEAYQTFYDLSYQYLYGIVNGIVMDELTSVNITNDLYNDIYSTIYQLRDPSGFFVWAGNMATNKAFSYICANRPELVNMQAAANQPNAVSEYVSDFAYQDQEPFIPEDFMQQQSVQNIINERIAGMPVLTRCIMQKYYYHDMPVKQIAEELRIPPFQVAYELSNVKRMMKDVIESSYGKDYKDNIRVNSLAEMSVVWLAFAAIVGRVSAGTIAADAVAGGAAAGGAVAGMATGAGVVGGAAGSAAGTGAVGSVAGGAAGSAVATAGSVATKAGLGVGAKIGIGVAAAAAVAGAGVGVYTAVNNGNKESETAIYAEVNELPFSDDTDGYTSPGYITITNSAGEATESEDVQITQADSETEICDYTETVENGYRILSFTTQTVLPVEVYDPNGKADRLNVTVESFDLFDYYTGMTLPTRYTQGDEKIGGEMSVENGDKSYEISYTETTSWEWGSWGFSGDGHNKRTVTMSCYYEVNVSEDYDGLCLWYDRSGMDHMLTDEDYEEKDSKEVLEMCDADDIICYRLDNLASNEKN